MKWEMCSVCCLLTKPSTKMCVCVCVRVSEREKERVTLGNESAK